MSRSVRGTKAAVTENGVKGVPPQKIFDTMKEMTGATDEDIQTMLQLCAGDVNEATTKLLENPFSKVTSKKEKRKQKEEDRKKEAPIPKPQEHRRSTHMVAGSGRGRGRGDGRPGGSGRGRRPVATSEGPHTLQDIPTTKAEEASDTWGVGNGDNWSEEKPAGGDPWPEGGQAVETQEAPGDVWKASTGSSWGASNGWGNAQANASTDPVPTAQQPAKPNPRAPAPGTSFANIIRGSHTSAPYDNAGAIADQAQVQSGSGHGISTEHANEDPVIRRETLEDGEDLSGTPVSPPSQGFQPSSLNLGSASNWGSAHGADLEETMPHTLRSNLGPLTPSTTNIEDDVLGVPGSEGTTDRPTSTQGELGSYGASQNLGGKADSFDQSSALSSLQLTFGNFNLKPQGMSEFSSSFGSAFDGRTQADSSVFGTAKSTAPASVGFTGGVSSAENMNDPYQASVINPASITGSVKPGASGGGESAAPAPALENDAFKPSAYTYSSMMSAGDQRSAIPTPAVPMTDSSRSALEMTLASSAPTQVPLRAGGFGHFPNTTITKSPGSGSFQQYGLGQYDAVGSAGKYGNATDSFGSAYARHEDLGNSRTGVFSVAASTSSPPSTLTSESYPTSGHFSGSTVKGLGHTAPESASQQSNLSSMQAQTSNPLGSMSNSSAPLLSHAPHMPYGNPAIPPGLQYGNAGMYQYPYYPPGQMYANMPFYNPYSQMGATAYNSQGSSAYAPSANTTYGVAPRGGALYSHPHSAGAIGTNKTAASGTLGAQTYGLAYGNNQPQASRYGGTVPGYEDLHNSVGYGLGQMKDKDGAAAYTSTMVHPATGHVAPPTHAAAGYQHLYNQRDYYGSQATGQTYSQQHPSSYSHQHGYGQYQQQYNQYSDSASGHHSSASQGYK